VTLDSERERGPSRSEAANFKTARLAARAAKERVLDWMAIFHAYARIATWKSSIFRSGIKPLPRFLDTI
jgi:hypothetical protein